MFVMLLLAARASELAATQRRKSAVFIFLGGAIMASSDEARAKETVSQDQVQEIVKAKRKRKRPDLANYGNEFAEPGDNSRFLRFALESWDLPPIDISDPKQVEQRIKDYFVHCAQNDRKPSIIGMGNWLGVDRDTVTRWRKGDYRKETHCGIIKKAVALLEEQWNDWMMNGKINPASGIFLGKNMFGYKDVQDVVVAPSSPLGDVADAAQIADKYKDALPSEMVED